MKYFRPYDHFSDLSFLIWTQAVENSGPAKQASAQLDAYQLERVNEAQRVLGDPEKRISMQSIL